MQEQATLNVVKVIATSTIWQMQVAKHFTVASTVYVAKMQLQKCKAFQQQATLKLYGIVVANTV